MADFTVAKEFKVGDKFSFAEKTWEILHMSYETKKFPSLNPKRLTYTIEAVEILMPVTQNEAYETYVKGPFDRFNALIKRAITDGYEG